jgi:hypothetical protein
MTSHNTHDFFFKCIKNLSEIFRLNLTEYGFPVVILQKLAGCLGDFKLEIWLSVLNSPTDVELILQDLGNLGSLSHSKLFAEQINELPHVREFIVKLF